MGKLYRSPYVDDVEHVDLHVPYERRGELESEGGGVGALVGGELDSGAVEKKDNLRGKQIISIKKVVYYYYYSGKTSGYIIKVQYFFCFFWDGIFFSS